MQAAVKGGGRRKEGGPREEEEGKRKEGGTRIGVWEFMGIDVSKCRGLTPSPGGRGTQGEGELYSHCEARR